MTATHGEGAYGNATGVTTPTEHKMAQITEFVKTTTPNVIRPGVLFNGNASLITGKANMSYDVSAFSIATQRSATSGVMKWANDGTYNATTTAAPGSNSRIDLIVAWHREYALDGTNSDPVIFVVQGTAAASPVAPSLAAYPGAIELGRATVAAGITATTSATITQTSPFTSVDGGSVPFRNTTEMNLWTTANQGQTAIDLATDIKYGYFALFNTSTNPGGAKTAGWYPIPGGAEYGGKVVRGAGALTLAAGDTILGGASVFSTTLAGAAKEIGVAAFATPSWTAPIEGVYEVFVQVGGIASTNALVYVKKNNTTPGVTNVIAKLPAAQAGYIVAASTLEVELAAADTLTLSFYSNPAASTLGANPDDLQFGFRFKRPIRHA